MEFQLFQDVATIVTFVAPGYFALQVYSLIYTKRDRSFSRLFIESIIYSLPIAALTSGLWQLFTGDEPSGLTLGYVVLLIGIATSLGIAIAYLRTHWPLKNIAKRMGLGSPHEDFIKVQFQRINVAKASASAVTFQLKSGAIVSGTVEQMSDYNHSGRPMYFSLTNIAWFNEVTGEWDERGGNVIIARDEIEFIETGKLTEK